MISLTDEGVARLAIAATAVAPERRSEWLQAVAEQLERPSPAAAKMRAYRSRRKRGHCVLRIEVDDTAVPAALVTAGLLNEAAQDDRAAIAAAVEQALALLVTPENSKMR